MIYWYEQDLKKLFTQSVKHYTKANHVDKLWDCIIEMMRPNQYYNLDRIKDILEFIELDDNLIRENANNDIGSKYGYCKLGYIPKQVAIALCLQYTVVAPEKPNGFQKSAEYANEALGYFGINELIINEVMDLILVNTRLQPPLETENYPTRLMHDLRNCKLAFPWESFHHNAELLRKEFSKTKNEDFLRLHYKLYKFLSKQKNLFSLPCFVDNLTKQARENIERYKTLIQKEYFTSIENSRDKDAIGKFIDDFKEDAKAERAKSKESDFGIGDVVKDNYTNYYYLIKELCANHARVAIFNHYDEINKTSQVPSGPRWGQILYLTLYTERFKLISRKFATSK